MVKGRLRYREMTGVLVLAVFLYMAGLMGQTAEKSPDYGLKYQAAMRAAAAQRIIGNRLTGEEYTPLTTTLGSAEAKQLSLQPDFAAVAVELLGKAGVKPGDRVAVNVSGSFPALNIAVLAAVETIGAQPVITSSVGASTWGANRGEYTWLDMEGELVKAGFWPWRSAAAAIGGVGDGGGGMTEAGVAMAQAAIGRNGIPFLAGSHLAEGVTKRLEIYRGGSGRLPGVLVNVGGSQVMFGEQGHRVYLHQGLLQGYQAAIPVKDGLAAAFFSENRPVIHFLNIGRMAAEYGIVQGGPAGSSRIYYRSLTSMPVRALLIIGLTGVLGILWYGQRREWWQGPCR